jgi:nitrite reductase/ring-hydroxylating ferredoxin subunit
VTTEATRLKLCSTNDVSPGSALKVETGGLVLAVFNIGDDFFVIDDACTHGPGALSEGYIDGYTVECDFHQGSFDIRTGAPVLPPCIIPVKTYKVVVEDGVVSIDL